MLKDYIKELILSESALYSRELASSTHDKKLQLQIAKSRDFLSMMYLSHNPDLCHEGQRILFYYDIADYDRSFLLRNNLASNPAIIEELQIEIIMNHKLSSSFTRIKLARNPYITGKVQTMLAKDTDYDVRVALAKNPKIFIQTQKMLLMDKDPNVKAALKSNPNVFVTEDDLIDHAARHEELLNRNLRNKK
jgi:hypothetical protein